MTLPSLYEQIGIYVSVSDPLWTTERNTDLQEYTEEIRSYQHTKSAFIGNDKAVISVISDHFDANVWLDSGLGRDISVYDETLTRRFNGFVNQINVVIGNVPIVYGPLLALANRVSAVYAPVDTTVNPPTVGDRTVSPIVQDAESQDRYGIIEKVLSVGQIPQTEAHRFRDTYLEEHKEPETSQRIDPASSGEILITLNILGYGYFLEAYVYNQNVNSGTTTLSSKIEAILTADPNALISTDYSNVDFNGFLVARYENDDPYGLTVIKELVALGDINDDRYLFQIGDDRKAYYFEQPVVVEYEGSIADMKLREVAGGELHPWAIEPGKWVFETDFLTERPKSVDINKDPRMVFIENVTFNAPYNFNIEGSKTSTTKQMLAKFGMKGVAT